MRRKKYTIEEVAEIFNERDCELISEEYVDNKTPLQYICNKHKEKGVQQIRLNTVLNGCGCYYCGKIKNSKNTRTSVDKIREICEAKDFTLIEVLYGHPTKVKYICNKHPNKGEQITALANLPRTNGCRQCYYDKERYNKYTIEDAKIEFEKRGYILLSTEYKNVATNLDYICPHHREKGILHIALMSVLAGCGCSYCVGKAKYKYEEVKEYIESVEGYKLLSDDYINGNKKLKIQCDKGHIYKATFSHFKNNGSRCPFCDSSKGEVLAKEILQQNNIYFKEQYKLKGCKGKSKSLRFDFAIFKDAEYTDLVFLLEIDGDFHRELINVSKNKEKTKKSFENTQRNDKKKNEFCQENNIKLIRLPYYTGKLDLLREQLINLLHNIK